MEQYFGSIPLVPADATWNDDKSKNTGMTYLYGSNWKALYGE